MRNWKLPLGFTAFPVLGRVQTFRTNTGRRRDSIRLSYKAECSCGATKTSDCRKRLGAWMTKHRHHMPEWAGVTAESLRWAMTLYNSKPKALGQRPGRHISGSSAMLGQKERDQVCNPYGDEALQQPSETEQWAGVEINSGSQLARLPRKSWHKRARSASPPCSPAPADTAVAEPSRKKSRPAIHSRVEFQRREKFPKQDVDLSLPMRSPAATGAPASPRLSADSDTTAATLGIVVHTPIEEERQETPRTELVRAPPEIGPNTVLFDGKVRRHSDGFYLPVARSRQLLAARYGVPLLKWAALDDGGRQWNMEFCRQRRAPGFSYGIFLREYVRENRITKGERVIISTDASGRFRVSHGILGMQNVRYRCTRHEQGLATGEGDARGPHRVSNCDARPSRSEQDEGKCDLILREEDHCPSARTVEVHVQSHQEGGASGETPENNSTRHHANLPPQQSQQSLNALDGESRQARQSSPGPDFIIRTGKKMWGPPSSMITGTKLVPRAVVGPLTAIYCEKTDHPSSNRSPLLKLAGGVSGLHAATSLRASGEAMQACRPEVARVRIITWMGYLWTAIPAVLGPQHTELLSGVCRSSSGLSTLCGLVFVMEFQRMVAWVSAPRARRRVGRLRQALLFSEQGTTCAALGR
eukprot:jgi/Botrbrau1/11221/Bobra.0075s0017.1